MPSEAVTEFPVLVQVPWLTEAVVKVNPAGKASVTTMELAGFGPRFVTLSVKVMLLERFTAAGATELLNATSAALPEQQTMLLMAMLSIYQPTLLVLLSVPHDQRS